MPSTFGANLPARLFGEYDDVSFLGAGLRIPVSLGDLIQRMETISANQSWAQGIGGLFPKPRVPIHHKVHDGRRRSATDRIPQRAIFVGLGQSDFACRFP